MGGRQFSLTRVFCPDFVVSMQQLFVRIVSFRAPSTVRLGPSPREVPAGVGVVNRWMFAIIRPYVGWLV